MPVVLQNSSHCLSRSPLRSPIRRSQALDALTTFLAFFARVPLLYLFRGGLYFRRAFPLCQGFGIRRGGESIKGKRRRRVSSAFESADGQEGGEGKGKWR